MLRLRFVVGLLLFATMLRAAELPTMKLKVEHLACESCAEQFKNALQPLCKKLTLDFKKGEALCQYEPPITPKKILSKARKTGLDTELID